MHAEAAREREHNEDSLHPPGIVSFGFTMHNPQLDGANRGAWVPPDGVVIREPGCIDSIVKAASENSGLVRQDLIDQPVLLVDAPGPAAGRLML